MPRPIVAALLLGALACASAGRAEEERPDTQNGEPIVVTGTRDLENEVRDFVAALTPAPAFGQLGRFEWQVCPGALGVSANQKQKLATRMRQVAAAANIPLADASCRPNVLLVVTEDKTAFIETLRRRHPEFLGNMPSRQIRRLLRDPGPAAAWQVAGPPLNADGQPMGVARMVISDQQPDADGSFYLNDTSRPDSRISAAARRPFIAAMVVVEGSALNGLSTTQLADYAAMRAFARIEPARLPAGGPPTILRILEAPMGSAVPLTLTPTDLGFLRGLYASDRNLYAGAQRSGIREAVRAEQERADQAAE